MWAEEVRWPGRPVRTLGPRLWRGLITALTVWPVLTLWALLLAVFSPPAAAHSLPDSQLWVDAREDGATLTLQVPLAVLELALHLPLTDPRTGAPAGVLPQRAAALSAYLLQHVGARSADAPGR